MIKNIIFDWSGVVNDSVENLHIVVNRMFAELHLNPISLLELKQEWEQPYMRFYNKYAPNLTLEQQQAAFRRAIVGIPASKSYPGIVESIKDFKRKGIKMAVLSSDYPDTLLLEITSFGLEDIFCEVITNSYEKTSGVIELIKKHDFKLDETIFIGDSNHEIEAGKNAGIKTGAVTWGFSTRERLEALKPDFVISTIDDLQKCISESI